MGGVPRAAGGASGRDRARSGTRLGRAGASVRAGRPARRLLGPAAGARGLVRARRPVRRAGGDARRGRSRADRRRGRTARAEGAARISVIANPRAVEFYERVGFMPGEPAETPFGPAAWMHLNL